MPKLDLTKTEKFANLPNPYDYLIDKEVIKKEEDKLLLQVPSAQTQVEASEGGHSANSRGKVNSTKEFLQTMTFHAIDQSAEKDKDCK